MSLPRILIHTAEEKDTRRKLVAAMIAQNNTRILKNKNERSVCKIEE